jgi:N-formylglutamate amidohydrolase
MNEFYQPHHDKLEDAVVAQLKQFGKSLIIDCHSFSDIPLRRDLDQDNVRPDYCLGTDAFHSSGELIKTAEQFFKKKNLSLGLNKPYAGSMVPAKYYQKDPNVQSIMLEINRKLYLEPGTKRKSNNYSVVKETVNEFIRVMEHFPE